MGPRHVPIVGDANHGDFFSSLTEDEKKDKIDYEHAPQNIGTWADGVARPNEDKTDNGTLMYRSLTVGGLEDTTLEVWDKKEVMDPRDDRWAAYLESRAENNWCAVLNSS